MTGASRHSGSSSLPSSVMEPDILFAAREGAWANPTPVTPSNKAPSTHFRQNFPAKNLPSNIGRHCLQISSKVYSHTQQPCDCNDERLGDFPFHQNEKSRYSNLDRPIILDGMFA